VTIVAGHVSRVRQTDQGNARIMGITNDPEVLPMATTLTAPSQTSAPRWVLAAVAALAAFALVIGLSMALSSDSNAPATTRSVPQVSQVVGSADSLDHAAPTEHVTRAEARRNAANERSAESRERRVPARAF
jgi:hypothetical protein